MEAVIGSLVLVGNRRRGRRFKKTNVHSLNVYSGYLSSVLIVKPRGHSTDRKRKKNRFNFVLTMPCKVAYLYKQFIVMTSGATA